MFRLTLLQKVVPCLCALLLMAPGNCQAQREVLPNEQLAEFQKRLPDAATATQVTALKTYLNGLRDGATRQTANAMRVADDIRAGNLPADAFFSFYEVPAMSPEMRLPDSYPQDGTFQGQVEVVLAQDEYEPASFVVFPFASVGKVEIKVSDLKNTAGDIFPKENLDLKVVKVWYQNGNGWFSYFQDVGLQLVPELLLRDENLIHVDTAKTANYARVRSQGKEREVWISAPRKIDAGFDAYQEGFADTKELQPVAFEAGQFKQFILTAHALPGTKAGTYRGNIQVAAEGRKTSSIPVVVRVLPFQLPLPKANYDIDKNFLVTLMGAWPRVSPEHTAFLPTLQNLRRHNILYLGPNAGPNTPSAQAELQVRLMKEAGFQTDFIFGGNLPWVGGHDGTPLTFDELVTLKRSATAWRVFYKKHFGETTAAVGLGDEQGASWIMKTRPAWRIAHEEGLKTNLAGHHDGDFGKGGYMLDVRPIAGSPANAQEAEQWKAIGNGHTGFYANQHNGSENPDFVRRQHGLLGYLSNFDMVDNYEFAYGPWNDLSTELYKPMVLAYPTHDGLVDTLAWEGFREGIDDIRYATKLRQLARAAIESGDLDRVYEGRKVRQWLASMDGTKADLNAVRMEMIEKIMRLTQMAAAQSERRP